MVSSATSPCVVMKAFAFHSVRFRLLTADMTFCYSAG